MKLNSFAFLADDELIKALRPHSKAIEVHEETALFEQGEPAMGVYLIHSGEVALVMRSDSGVAVMCVQAGPGSLVGLPGAIANAPYTLTAIARRDSEIRFTSRKDLCELLATRPALYPGILEILSAEVREMRRAFLDCRERDATLA